jgi:hypothetical protein
MSRFREIKWPSNRLRGSGVREALVGRTGIKSLYIYWATMKT